MNRSQAKKYLDVIKAFADGKTIESRYYKETEWFEVESPNFTPCADYRIKPEPKVFYVNVYKNFLGANNFSTRKTVDLVSCGDRLAVLKITNTDGKITAEVQDG